MRNKRKAGFTLVEIMIVVAIIGLLAAIAVPSFIRARTTSQNNTCINNLRQLSGAIDQWAIENNAVGSTAVTPANCAAYVKSYPECPAGGAYTLVDVDTNPICTVSGTGGHLAVLPNVAAP